MNEKSILTGAETYMRRVPTAQYHFRSKLVCILPSVSTSEATDQGRATSCGQSRTLRSIRPSTIRRTLQILSRVVASERTTFEVV